MKSLKRKAAHKVASKLLGLAGDLQCDTPTLPKSGERTVTEMFPAKYPGHRLTAENSLNGMTPAHMVVIEKGTFFNKTAWLMREGWQVVGWTTPPFPRGDADAVVFEKTTPAAKTMDFWTSREPGIYWIHANAGGFRVII